MSEQAHFTFPILFSTTWINFDLHSIWPGQGASSRNACLIVTSQIDKTPHPNHNRGGGGGGGAV